MNRSKTENLYFSNFCWLDVILLQLQLIINIWIPDCITVCFACLVTTWQKKNMKMNTHCCGFRHDVDGASLLTEWVGGEKCTIERDKAALLTFLTRSKWTSPGGSGRTLLFRHPITSPWAAAQSATVATRSPASSPPRPIQHSQGIQRPGCTHTRSKRSWMKDDPTPLSSDDLVSALTPHRTRQTLSNAPQVHGYIPGKSRWLFLFH